MSDYAAMRVYEALIDGYSAEAAGREPRKRDLSALEDDLLDAVKRACEWRLGLADSPGGGWDMDIHPSETITPEVLILCLKRLLKSAHTWNKAGGRKGYVSYISQFIV